MAKINLDDLILVNRDGVDHQAKVSDLPGSGGGGLDDILNAPVVKGPKYIIWEDVKGVYTPMTLSQGDGGDGSTFKAEDFDSKYNSQTSIDGTIQYKSSMSPEGDYASISMAQVKNLTSVSLAPDGTPGYEGVEVESVAMGGGCFHSHCIKKDGRPGGGRGSHVDYLLELKFVNCNGDTDTLFVDCTTKNYVAMRREDVDLREMEALDAEIKAEIKAENAAARAKRIETRGQADQDLIDATKKENNKAEAAEDS